MNRSRLEAAVREKDEHAVIRLVSAAIEATERQLKLHVEPILRDVFNQSAKVSAGQLVDSLRTAGNGSNQYQSRGRQEKEKSQRAVASHVPVTMKTRSLASASEREVAKHVGGTKTDDNDAMDVTAKVGNTLHGVEVKTLTTNSNDKITMHPSSLDRKQAWADRTGASLHTVVFDKRKDYGTKGYSGHRMYYKSGVGSFRLSTMTPVTSGAHLRSLMKIK